MILPANLYVMLLAGGWGEEVGVQMKPRLREARGYQLCIMLVLLLLFTPWTFVGYILGYCMRYLS